MRAVSSRFSLFCNRLRPYTRTPSPLFHHRTFATFRAAQRNVSVTVYDGPETDYDFCEEWYWSVERLDDYEPGGRHPVHLNETYHDGRYRIVEKLGHGTFATVWLTWDALRQKFAALKVLRADVSENNKESEILARLAAGRADHPGRRHVTTLVDNFFITGPHGRHRIIVTEALGYTIALSKEYGNKFMFPIQIARAIVAQFLLALSYVHSCGVVHGDLYDSNLLLKHPRLASSSVEEFYQGEDEPRRMPVTGFGDQPPGSKAPRYCVPPVGILIHSDRVTEPHLVIADFGESFLCETDSHVDVKLRTPTLYLPPEAIFNEGINQGADIWTAASTLYEILGDGSLFEAWPVNKDAVVADMISTLGKDTFPKHWWNSWAAQRRYFHPDGNWVQHPEWKCVVDYRPLAERVRGLRDRDNSGSFSSHELETIEDLLCKMLKYDPADRITAEEALKSDWMTQYGLPAIANPNSGPPVL